MKTKKFHPPVNIVRLALRMIVFQTSHMQQKENFYKTHISALLKELCFKEADSKSNYSNTANK